VSAQHHDLWMDEAPSFSEPWHAEAFALTMQMSRAGYFSWEQWVKVFSGQIAASPQSEAETTNDAYFRQWMQALAILLEQCDLLDESDIAEYMEHWRRSYFHTVHGDPIHFNKSLTAIPADALAELEQAHDHHHDHHHHPHHHHGHASTPKPVAVDTVTPASTTR